MFKFIFTSIFTIFFTCFLMQDPLLTYFEQKYNKDFGLRALQENALFAKGDEFYKFLKTLVGDKQKTDINSGGNESEILDKNESVKTELSIDANLTVIPTKQINLKSGDEILFIGDSIMKNIATMAKKLFTEHGVKVIDISKHSTGLINKKYYDWQNVSDKALKNNKNIKLIVVLFGANDSWGRTINGRYRELGSKEWTYFYKKRVEEIYEVAKNNDVEILWLGVPCMKNSDFNAKMDILNEIFAVSSKEFNKIYINVSDVICVDNNYTSHINNDNNESVKIRASDGIHISIAGGRMIARQIIKEVKIDENITK